MKIRVAAVALALGSLACAAAAVQAPSPAVPKWGVVLSNPHGSRELRTVLTVTDPVPEYECVEIVWYWGDESLSREASDCDPDTANPGAVRSWSRSHKYRGPGSYDVKITVTLRGQVVTHGRQTVTVLW